MINTVPGNLLTTAMAVMPHTDVARALDMALLLDVPFWPQLPNYSCYNVYHTGDIEKIKDIEAKGAGAIVLKSIYEEEVA